MYKPNSTKFAIKLATKYPTQSRKKSKLQDLRSLTLPKVEMGG
jgi:hypothetical protein